MTSYIRSLWYNQPRCRRELAKSLLEWHALYDLVVRVINQLPPPVRLTLRTHLHHSSLAFQSSSTVDPVFQLPRAIALWRCSMLREIVLSGFQMELYNADEKTFASWYTTQIIEEHIATLDTLMPLISKGMYSYLSSVWTN